MSVTHFTELLAALLGLVPAMREVFTGAALRESLADEPKKLLKLASKFRSSNPKYAKVLRLQAKATEVWTINRLDIWLSFRLLAVLVCTIPSVLVLSYFGIGAYSMGRFSNSLVAASCLMDYLKSCLIYLIATVLLPFSAITIFSLQRNHSINKLINAFEQD